MLLLTFHRRDLIDSALLRPGRFEVHIEVRESTCAAIMHCLIIFFSSMWTKVPWSTLVKQVHIGQTNKTNSHPLQHFSALARRGMRAYGWSTFNSNGVPSKPVNQCKLNL